MTCECYCGTDNCNENPPRCDSDGFHVPSQNVTYIASYERGSKKEGFYAYLKYGKPRFEGYMVDSIDRRLRPINDSRGFESAFKRLYRRVSELFQDFAASNFGPFIKVHR